jgi:hypothetical protein
MLAPGVDIPGVTSGASFNTELARTTSSSINVDLGISASADGSAAVCTSNGLVKGEGSAAVYYCGANGSRYVFMNEQVYFTWYANFDTVLTVSDSTLASIPLSGVVTHRPGVKMVKIESDPKVYAIGRGGLLRWVSSEAIALGLYGADWNQMVQDIPVSLFARFTLGPDITE